MAGKESRQCPHFDTHDGVCGCPEFWQATRRTQNDQPSSTLREIPNTRYSHNVPNSKFSSCVNVIPLPDRTKIQPTTPGPPGPPKETCFFWYHGACRRGNECDRPHEAHPTWPIPPPPGFRHFQPCTLPLCPLRTDLKAARKPQEHQRRRTIGGQMDGAAFSHATIAGESSSDSDSANSTDTDMSEADEDASTSSSHAILGVSVGCDFDPQTLAGNADEGGTDQEGEAKVQRELGKNGFDSNYVNLSQLPSPQSLVQEQALLSVSHSGTLRKRRQSSRPLSPDSSNNKCVKLEDSGPVDPNNAVSILEHPRTMPQWDIKSPGFRFGGHYSDPGALPFGPMRALSPQLFLVPTVNNCPASLAPSTFDPPKGPRGMSALQPICFFYYHKGYCNPKRGRRCDYLHDVSTSQQTVSLPHGIDNHDSTCPLPLCPVRLRGLGQVKQEPDLLASKVRPMIKTEQTTPLRFHNAPFPRIPDSSPRDTVLSVRDRPPKGILGKPLPQLTRVARERLKEQKRQIERAQAEKSMIPAVATAVDEAESMVQVKRTTRKRRVQKQVERLRRQFEGEEAIRQGPKSVSDALSMQRPLPAPFVMEEILASAAPPPVGNPEKKRKKRGNKESMHSQRADELWLEDTVKNEGTWRFTPEPVQGPNESWALQGFSSSPRTSNTPVVGNGRDQPVSIDKALQVMDTIRQDPRKWRPPSANPQRTPSGFIMAQEYPQEPLVLSAKGRRAQIHKKQATRCEAYHPSRQTGYKLRPAVSDEPAHLAPSAATSLDFEYRVGERVEGLMRKPRCQKCQKMKESCDCERHYKSCMNGGIEAGSCVDSVGDNNSKDQDQAAAAAGSKAGYELHEGNDRLDWDTDLVRRLFGEIE